MSQNFKLFKEYDYQGYHIFISVRDSCVDPVVSLKREPNYEKLLDSIANNEILWFDINVKVFLGEHLLSEWVLTSLCYPTYDDAFADDNSVGSKHIARVLGESKRSLRELIELSGTVDY